MFHYVYITFTAKQERSIQTKKERKERTATQMQTVFAIKEEKKKRKRSLVLIFENHQLNYFSIWSFNFNS